MAFQTPLLTARTLILAKLETDYNQDPSPVAASDAFLVSEADVRVDPNVLERNNFSPSLSPTAISIGRKLVTVTFTHELKGSGTFGDVAKVGTLLRGCGFSETSVAASAGAAMPDPTAGSGNSGTISSWSKDVLPTSRFGDYVLECVTAGASTIAELQPHGNPHFEGDNTILESLSYTADASGSSSGTLVWNITDLTSPVLTVAGTWVEDEVVSIVAGGVTFSVTVDSTATATSVAGQFKTAMLADAGSRFTGTDNTAGVLTVDFSTAAEEKTITSATTSVVLGASIGAVTPTFSGSLTVGDIWTFSLVRPGLHYDPISTGFESLTIYVYFDGLLHIVTGCRGTVSFSGEAGAFATASFTFTGQYVAPSDSALPSGAVYESSLPAQIESAALTFDDLREVCAQSFSIDMNNVITARDCMNGVDGFNGVQLTDRDPQGGVNPEATLEATHPFWSRFSDATIAKFHIAAGTIAGNIVHFTSQTVQYSGITYSDRNGTRVYDIALRFSALTADGDDEIKIIFS